MANDLTIQQIKSLMDSSPLARMREIQSSKPAATAPQDANAPSFADTLRQSIAEINSLQNAADASIARAATNEQVDVQETILAVEKADISFKLMMEVRNKIISAYQEVMRSQV